MFDFVVQIFISFSFLCGGIFMIYMFFDFYKKGNHSKNWIEVPGTIIESKMEYKDETLNTIIVYKYLINGIEFTCDRLFFKTFDLDDVDYTKKYPIGKRLKVYYNPENPKEAVLEKGLRPEIQLFILFAIILFIVAFIVSPLKINI